MSKYNFKKYIKKKEAYKNKVDRLHSYMLAEAVKDNLHAELHKFIDQPIDGGNIQDIIESQVHQFMQGLRAQENQVLIGYPKVDIYGSDAHVSFSVRAPHSTVTISTDTIINLNGDYHARH